MIEAGLRNLDTKESPICFGGNFDSYIVQSGSTEVPFSIVVGI